MNQDFLVDPACLEDAIQFKECGPCHFGVNVLNVNPYRNKDAFVDVGETSAEEKTVLYEVVDIDALQ